jgi:hypothetical protein
VLRDPKQKRKAVESALGEQQPPKTGLNYVELLAEEHNRQMRQKQAGELSLAMKEVKQP